MKNLIITIASFLVLIPMQAQLLQSYVMEAEENNPEIQAYELRYDIAVEKSNEQSNLPNTELGAGYFVSEPETRTGAQKLKLSVNQMFPWFGTNSARENYATSMAESQFLDVVIAKKKLKLDISQSYYRLYAINAKKQIADDNITLLKTYERLALTAVEVGKADAYDVLRLQIRQNEMEQKKRIYENDFLAEQLVFNKLLNRNDSIKIIVEESLIIPIEGSLVSISDSLLLHPELLRYDRMYESVEKLELVNQKERAPNLGFGLDYIAVEERPNMSFSDNGKDIIMPMMSVSVPIFNSKYRSRTSQNKMRQDEIMASKDNNLNKLETILGSSVHARQSAKLAFEIQSKNVIQAKYAEEILINGYETNRINFDNILDIQELQLKFEIDKIEAIKQYFIHTSIINYLTQ